jgi:osmotically-inducible protein OsmY
MKRFLALLAGAVAVAAAARIRTSRSRGPAPEPVRPAPVPTPAAPTAPPPAPSGRDDNAVEREVEARLDKSPVAAEADVSVEVHDRVASLEGTAPDAETAVAIADEAAHVEGVQGIDNRLRPTGESAGDPQP